MNGGASQDYRVMAHVLEEIRQITVKPVDPFDAAMFPEIAAARAGLSPGRKAELDKEWNQ